MRPPAAMPLDEMMTAGPRTSLMAFDSCTVRAIAGGRFEQQDVGRGHGLGIAQDRPVVPPEIPGEYQTSASDLELDGRRTEDVPRAPEQCRHTFGGGKRLAVAARLHETQGGLSVLKGVQREGGPVRRVAAAIRPLGVLFLKMRGIGEHHAEQLCGTGRAVDGSAEPLPGE